MNTFPCAQCQNPIDWPPDLAGQYVPCPFCGFHVPVPADPSTAFNIVTAPAPARWTGLPEAPTNPALLAELPDPLPADIAALGAPLAVFRYRGGVSWASLVLGGVVLAAGMNLSLGLLIAYLDAGGSTVYELLLLLGPALAFTILGADIVSRALRMTTLKVLIFTDGFARVCWPRHHVCRWNQVRRVGQFAFHRPLFAKSCGFIVERDGGRGFRFDLRLERLDELVQLILRYTTPHLLQRALADHAAGRTLDYNAFRVRTDGVARGWHCLEWDRIRVAQRLKRRIWVWQWDQEKPWAQVDVDQVSHPDVFVRLVNTILAERRDGQQSSGSATPPS
ncbi:MAG: hypothetical protein JNM56_14965 [Planctomycetia bacterium]|nr:hypothetical protein [Planctomycetia bacterium]